MNNVLNYKGFTAKVEFSADDDVFFGRLLGIDDIVTFEGKTVAELKQAFQETVDFHIEVCEKTGQKLKKNYNGKLLFRCRERAAYRRTNKKSHSAAPQSPMRGQSIQAA